MFTKGMFKETYIEQLISAQMYESNFFSKWKDSKTK